MDTKTVSVCHLATMTNLGGVETFLIDFLTNAKPAMIEYSLMTSSSDPDIVAPIVRAGIPTFEPNRRIRYDPSALYQAISWMRNAGVNLVHTHNAYTSVWGTMAAWFAGRPKLVFGEHGSAWWVRSPRSWFYGLALRRANLVVANSKASAKMLMMRFGARPEIIRVIYNAVPPLPSVKRTEIRSKLGISSNQFLIGSVGRLDMPKYFRTFIEAAKVVSAHNHLARFIIIGGGPLEEEHRSLIGEMGLQEKFFLTGWREDARELIQAFDLFVSTSVRESFGNSLVEASLASLPIIAPRVDGIPEVIVHGETGILLDPKVPPIYPKSVHATPHSKYVVIDGKLSPPLALNSRELAEEILDLSDNKEKRSKLGAVARRRAEKLYSMERYRDELETTYIELMQGKWIRQPDYSK